MIDGKLFVAIGSLVAKRTLNPSEKFTISELVTNEAKISVCVATDLVQKH